MVFKEMVSDRENEGPISLLSVLFCAYELPCLMYKPDTDPGV